MCVQHGYVPIDAPASCHSAGGQAHVDGGVNVLELEADVAVESGHSEQLQGEEGSREQGHGPPRFFCGTPIRGMHAPGVNPPPQHSYLSMSCWPGSSIITSRPCPIHSVMGAGDSRRGMCPLPTWRIALHSTRLPCSYLPSVVSAGQLVCHRSALPVHPVVGAGECLIHCLLLGVLVLRGGRGGLDGEREIKWRAED